jgi:hypothetical protein
MSSRPATMQVASQTALTSGRDTSDTAARSATGNVHGTIHLGMRHHLVRAGSMIRLWRRQRKGVCVDVTGTCGFPARPAADM